MIINVREMGAVGNGVADDTAAVVKAIDKVRAAGGGTICFDAGTYLCGTLALCSNLEIVLGPGAVLKAQEDIAYFPKDTNLNARTLNHYFLYLNNVENVTISGPGRIDGSGYAFWEKEYFDPSMAPLEDTRQAPDEVYDPVYRYYVLQPKNDRIVVIYGTDSRNITIRNMKIEDAPAYTVWLIGCEDITISNLVVHNRRSGPNTDVLDIDCSRRVRISDCFLAAGDDSIAIKSDPKRTGTDFACEDIVVSNCVFSSATCGIRVGYEGDAPIRDMTFSNITMYDTRHGIDILSIHPVCRFSRIEHGTPMDRLIFSNITMRNVGQPFFIWTGIEKPETGLDGYMNDFIFSNIVADASGTAWIGTELENVMTNFTFDNVTVRCKKNTYSERSEDPTALPIHWGGPYNAGSMVLRGLKNVKMRNFICETMDPDSEALYWKDMTDFEVNNTAMPAAGSAKKI